MAGRSAELGARNLPGGGCAVSVQLSQVAEQRRSALNNGFSLVRVRTGQKIPAAGNWQRGESNELLCPPMVDSLNTGMLCDGLRVVDIDVDDPATVSGVLTLAAKLLPKNGLIRIRPPSWRSAIVFRATSGAPRKRALKGSHGKIEVLGAGQQVVIFGTHPSGAQLSWLKGRSPATVRATDIPAVSEAELELFLAACIPVIRAADGSITCAGNEPVSHLPMSRPLNWELTAGIGGDYWFNGLSPAQMQVAVRRALDAIPNGQDDPRERWLRILFAMADAAHRGCPNAREIALEWSRRGAGWTSEADFNKAWNSFRPGQGIKVGTLFHSAEQYGFLLEAIALHAPPQALPGSTASISVSDLPMVPAKRQWLHGADLIRGRVSLLVAPGGRGKSSFLISLALACASGRPLLGSHVFGGPLRVLLVSLEDSTNEVALRLRGAMLHHGISDRDVAGLRIIGAERVRLSLLRTQGGDPALNPAAWGLLEQEIASAAADIVLIDPIIAAMGGVSVNDNSAAALFMEQLVKLAVEKNVGLMFAHHAAKYRDTTSADAAMGAASFVNLARVCIAIEPLKDEEAVRVGIPPWDARSYFRIVSTKQNLAPPSDTDRWFRLTSVEMQNATPPTYPNGDNIAVVEPFRPGGSGPAFSSQILSAARDVIANAIIPPSTSKRSSEYAVSRIARAIAPYRGGRESEVEAKSVLDHLIRTGVVRETEIDVPRPGRGPYRRKGLVVTGVSPPISQQPPEGETRLEVEGAGNPATMTRGL